MRLPNDAEAVIFFAADSPYFALVEGYLEMVQNSILNRMPGSGIAFPELDAQYNLMTQLQDNLKGHLRDFWKDNQKQEPLFEDESGKE